ncbi:MAG: sigma-70 family RNA polymerase sigma factor [Thermodesulfobacteriota bacterium]
MTTRDEGATDAALVAAVLGGDHEAFAGILRRHSAAVSRIVSRHLPAAAVPDGCQETFVRAFRGLAGFRQQESLGHWLAAIAVRACHDYWRERYRSRELPAGSLSDEGEGALAESAAQVAWQHHESARSRREARAVLDWALDQLAPTDRLILALTVLEGRSTREAADLLGLSLVNVKVRALRARRRLHQLLAKEEERLRRRGA